MLSEHFDGPSELAKAEPTYSLQLKCVENYFLIVAAQLNSFWTHSNSSQIVIGPLFFQFLFYCHLFLNNTSSICCIWGHHNLLLDVAAGQTKLVFKWFIRTFLLLISFNRWTCLLYKPTCSCNQYRMSFVLDICNSADDWFLFIQSSRKSSH